MLGILFLLSAAVLAVSWMRPPQTLWHKVAVGAAVVGLLAVLVAWVIEWMMSVPVA
jgi:hypothetical protein